MMACSFNMYASMVSNVGNSFVSVKFAKAEAHETTKTTTKVLEKPNFQRNVPPTLRGIHPPKPIMHVAYSPYFYRIYKFSPIFAIFLIFPLFLFDLHFLGAID